MAEDSFYDNLLRATDNTADITNEKYGTITKLENNLCSVKEEDTDLEHSNVPILNRIPCETGDKVVIGFINNSLYDPVITGNLSRDILKEVNDKLDEIIEHTITLDAIYPVGSIYMSINSVNPSLLFGGTWEQLKDTFLLSAGDNYEAGSIGGEATHTLISDEMPSHTHIQNSHNHTQNSHNHTQNAHAHNYGGKVPTIGNVDWQYTGARKMSYTSGSYYYPFSSSNSGGIGEDSATDNATATNKEATATNKEATATNQNTGGGQAHNNMPPYLTVFMWKRTA